MITWFFFILGFNLYAPITLGAQQVVDKVAAIVDNNVVLESEVNSILNTIKYNVQEDNRQLDSVTLRRQILDKLIMDKIIIQLAQRANITISDEQLDKIIYNIAANNNLTIDQLQSNLVNKSVDFNTYRSQISKEILTTEVCNDEIHHRIIILPQEVDSLTQQLTIQTDNSTTFSLSHILIPLPENSKQDQLDKAEALANYLAKQSKNGADFSKLAITYSADPQALKGGQMGWKKLEELPSLFAEPLQGAQKSNIVGPLRSGVGFHILKVNDNYNFTVTEVHARHILLCTSEVRTDQQARTTLENIATQIKSGRISFNYVAKQLSEDPGSANQGGDLGWKSPDIFDPVIRDTLMHLQKGEISIPIHSSFGWHLIQLIDTRQIDGTDAAQKDRAYRLLLTRKLAEETQTWMQEQRVSTYVKIIDNNE